MNGAHALIRTLVDAGVDVCFMNPGTSEMHFVAALDDVTEMRGCSPSSRAWPRERPTATAASPTGRRPRSCTWARVSATAWPTCTTPVEPTPRSSTSSATTPRTTSSTTPSSSPTSRPSPATSRRWIRTSAATRRVPSTLPTPWPPRWGPPGQVATLILPADVSLDRGRRTVSSRRRAETRARSDDDLVSHTRRPSCRATSPPCCSSAAGPAGPMPSSTPAASPTPPAPGSLPRPSPPDSSGAQGASPVDRLAYLAEFAAMQLEGLPTSSSWAHGHRCRSSPTPGWPATSCPTAVGSTCWPPATGTRPRPSPRWLPPSRPPPMPRPCSQPSARTCRRGRSPPTPSAGPSERSCPKAPSCPTRATPPGSSPLLTPPARRRTTGCASPAEPSVKGFP